MEPADEPGSARVHLVRDARRPGGLVKRAAARTAVLLVVATAVLPGCGGDGSAAAPRSVDATLAWVGQPQVYKPPELPQDRLLRWDLENDSLREVRLDADDARLVDARGDSLRSTIRFTSSFGHGLYSPRRPPKEADPELVRTRLGELAVLKPGESVPVTLSWRLGADGRGPVRLEVGNVQLPLPASQR